MLLVLSCRGSLMLCDHRVIEIVNLVENKHDYFKRIFNSFKSAQADLSLR